ncbi:MAG: aminoacyl--tRNA ligase-related protein [Candidatus Hodgkinia cicadicola]
MNKHGALARHSNGIYTILPYGMLILNKLQRLLKRIMSKLEAKEVLMPCAVRASLFANRFKSHPKMFITTANKLMLAPTAEDIALSLPNMLSLGKLYQIQLKFRNEPRPSANLIRGYEFVMKDCYMLFANRRKLLTEFKLMTSEYNLVFKQLGIKTISVIGDGSALLAKHSFEFVAPGTKLWNTSCYVHIHSLCTTSARYLSFAEDYVINHKVIVDSSYLRLTGLELAHAFIFNKPARASAWFASLGVGISRMLGFVLKSKPQNWALLAVCSVVVLNVARAQAAAAFALYVYCVLRCTKLNSVTFRTKLNTKVLLGMLKRLSPKLIVFVDLPVCGFLVRAEPQVNCLSVCAYKRALSLQRALALAHILEQASIC